jgi:hypothetical protein
MEKDRVRLVPGPIYPISPPTRPEPAAVTDTSAWGYQTASLQEAKVNVTVAREAIRALIMDNFFRGFLL